MATVICRLRVRPPFSRLQPGDGTVRMHSPLKLHIRADTLLIAPCHASFFKPARACEAVNKPLAARWEGGGERNCTSGASLCFKTQRAHEIREATQRKATQRNLTVYCRAEWLMIGDFRVGNVSPFPLPG